MSSSGTAEPAGADDQRGAANRPRHVPVLLAVGAILSLLLIVVGVLALLGQGSPTTSSPPPSAIVGLQLRARTFPRLPLVGAPGTMAAPWGDHHGAVLLFFADWCAVCHGEVRRLARELGPDIGTVHVVGFDGDHSTDAATAFVASNHIRFPVAHDGELEVADALVPAAFPATVFVSATGKIKAVHYGAISNMQLSAGLSMIGRP
jgi:AhpC/TSA family